jgi:hypothetical protein
LYSADAQACQDNQQAFAQELRAAAATDADPFVFGAQQLGSRGMHGARQLFDGREQVGHDLCDGRVVLAVEGAARLITGSP